MSNNRVIGKDGRIPWKCKEDLAFFKRMTTGGNLIMGNTTFKNVGLLPERRTYILTRNPSVCPKFIIDDEGEFVAQYGRVDEIPTTMWKDSWVCGGAEVYKLLLCQCSDLYLTIILDDYEGDTYMPDFEWLFPEQRVVVEKKNLWIVHYWRKTSLLEEAKREGLDWKIMGNELLWTSQYPAEMGPEVSRAWLEGFQSIRFV